MKAITSRRMIVSFFTVMMIPAIALLPSTFAGEQSIIATVYSFVAAAVCAGTVLFAVWFIQSKSGIRESDDE